MEGHCFNISSRTHYLYHVLIQLILVTYIILVDDLHYILPLLLTDVTLHSDLHPIYQLFHIRAWFYCFIYHFLSDILEFSIDSCSGYRGRSCFELDFQCCLTFFGRALLSSRLLYIRYTQSVCPFLGHVRKIHCHSFTWLHQNRPQTTRFIKTIPF
jgi:hypothetical protein